MAVTRRVLSVLALLAVLAACGDAALTSDEQSYQVDEPVDAVVVDARAAAITIEAGPGPIRVTERFRYGENRPETAHSVQSGRFTLTETGCRDDGIRCEVEFRIQVPAETRTDVTAKAGAVTLTGLTGPVQVTTDAGAIRGSGLGAPQVKVGSQAGATELEFTKAPASLAVRTEVGAVSLGLPPETAYAVSVTTEIGRSKVTVDQDPASKHRIEVQTRVGAVSIEPAS
ncbi:hypothetical protein AB0F81_09430 [Actinoplanes sp. NPDC024001]|uniref:hypothetical protein n=1 Tax=Actinoplanes sp. NPDC024001 TaxID=3154598 RepID=UPI0033D02633